jgi:hypothetical protein
VVEHLRRLSDQVRADPALPIVGAGYALLATFVVVTLVVMETSSYDIWSALIVGPLLILVSLPILAREAQRQGSRSVFHLLVLALLLKLVGALLRYYADFEVYEGQTDALEYHEAGIQWAGWLVAGEFHAHGQDLSGTGFIEVATGVLYAITRPTLLGGYLVYSWLAFWGLFFFYRAFVMAVPEGRSLSYAHLLFFLPSLIFWPSSIGKEAWMIFTLGLAAMGAAHVLRGTLWRGLVLSAGGLWLASMVRPHVAAMLALGVAVAVGLMLVRSRSGTSLARRIVSVAALGVLGLFLLGSSERFLQERRVDTDAGVNVALTEVERRTAQGGSEFSATLVESVGQLPTAAVTVTFRPFPFEANNFQALLTSLESAALLALFVVRVRWVLSAVRSVFRQPYVALAIVFIVAFVIAYSSISNFGILARQRTQVLPFLLVLLAVPPKRQADEPVLPAQDPVAVPLRGRRTSVPATR